jgi:CyaY protein
MNDSEFSALADTALAQIEHGLEASGVDLDFFMASAGVLEIEFADGSKIVVNRHGAAKEMWVAARAGGFHYRWDGVVWRDTRSGEELLMALSKLISAQGGVAITLG